MGINTIPNINRLIGGNILKNNNILKIGFMGILIFILVISASGCTSSSTNETKTFSDGAMSFNYPSFFNKTQIPDVNSSSFQIISSLETKNIFNTQFIHVTKNKTDVSPTKARDNSISKVKNDSTSNKILSVTTETNSNGVVVERYTYVNNGLISETYHVMYFKIGDDVYGIGVQGPDLFKQEIIKTTNIVFQSIKQT